MHVVAGTGRVIAGRYRLTDPIGRGAMGTVWRAQDELLDREVAVKELRIRDGLPEDERSRACARTLREARTAARLSHPGVITIYDVAEEDGRPWIVMELVGARSLDQVITSDGPLTPQRAAEAGRQLLGALAAAHAVGVLHRDVKPSNVLLAAGGRTVLTDFGIATFEGDPGLTQTGMVMGSPGFTAPERIRGNPATPASDLWSLGATLYAAVEGQGPFERRGGAITTMSAVINEEPPQARAAGALAPVISALLRKNPGDRPDAATAARMLGSAVPGPSSMPAHYEPWDPAPAEPGGPRGSHGPEAAGYPAGPVSRPDGGRTVTRSPSPGPGRSSISLARRLAPALMLPGRGSGRGWRAAAAPAAARRDAGQQGIALPGPEAPGAPGPVAGAPGTGVPAADPPNPTRAEAAWPGGTGDASAVLGGIGLGRAGLGRTGLDSTGLADTGLADTGLDAATAGPDGSVSAPGSTAVPAESREDATSSPAATRGLQPAAWSWPAEPSEGNEEHGDATRPSPSLRREPRGLGRRTILALGLGILVIAAAAGVIVAAVFGGGHRPKPASPPGRVSAPGNSHSNVPGDSPIAVAAGPPSTGPLPPGFHWHTVTAAAAGANAGFRVAVPDGWTVTRQRAATYLKAPGGSRYMEIDLTPHTYPDMLTEARWIATRTRAQGHFPGYRAVGIRAVQMRGIDAAAWQFTWRERGGVRVRVLDLMYIAQTSSGPQSYALYLSAPASDWHRSLAAFDTELRTFRPVPR